MRRLIALVSAAFLLLALSALPASAARGGEPGSPIAPAAIYADGELFGTIGQGALPYNGHDDSFDQLFLVPGQAPVSEAGPGNPDYNGGRWLPTPAEWTTDPYHVTSYHEVMMAVDAGDLVLGDPVYDGTFLCPLIRG
jgi:hypothetical protein